jgi:type I restriction enzyme S subunit
MRDGWVEYKFKDVATAVKGKLPKNKNEDGLGIPYLTANFLRSSKPDYWIENIEGAVTAEDGDCLILWDGAGAGDLFSAHRGVVSSTMAVVTTQNSKILREFLTLFISSKAEYIKETCRGTTVPHVSPDAIANMDLKIPPLSEQKRIVDLICSVDSYIEALQQQQNFARQMLQALCQKAFLVEGDFVQLHTIATCIMGQSPEGLTCNKDGIGTPLLTGPTEFQLNNWVGPPRQWTTNETKIAFSQDILFCVRGATAGRMNLTNYRSVIGRGLAAIRCEDPMDTHFVRFALQFGLNQLLPSAGGTIFPNISQSQLRGFKLPWPNETERRSLARLLKSVEENSEALDQNLATTKNLRSSLLHDLLSGEHEIPASYDKVIGAA